MAEPGSVRMRAEIAFGHARCRVFVPRGVGFTSRIRRLGDAISPGRAWEPASTIGGTAACPYSNPRCVARATAWARVLAPSLLRMEVTWKRAVRSEIDRARPISLFERPAATWRST